MLVVSLVLTAHLPPLAIRAHRHAFRLDTHIDLRQHFLLVDVDHSHQSVVLVGDVQPFVVGVQGELFGVRAGWQLFDDLPRGQVHHLNGVRVAGADVEQLVVVGKGKTTWAHADLKGFDGFHLVQVDDTDAVVFLIGNVGSGSGGRTGSDAEG